MEFVLVPEIAKIAITETRGADSTAVNSQVIESLMMTKATATSVVPRAPRVSVMTVSMSLVFVPQRRRTVMGEGAEDPTIADN